MNKENKEVCEMGKEYIQPIKYFYLPCSRNEIKIPNATEENKLYYYRVKLYELLKERIKNVITA